MCHTHTTLPQRNLLIAGERPSLAVNLGVAQKKLSSHELDMLADHEREHVSRQRE